MNWINVADRLPEEGQDVYFWEKHTDLPCVGWFKNKKFKPLVGDYVELVGPYAYGSIESAVCQENVLFWTPVEKSPYEEQSDDQARV